MCERAIERDVAGTVDALRDHIELTTKLLLDGYQSREPDGE
ncbi:MULTISPECIES: hypothetical protein [Amycolatopsis]|nr:MULTISPECIES: hypothetical protein [Amycolatopsis]